MEPVYWYRVDVTSHAITDEWNEVVSHYGTLRIIEYKVLKETPKGAWLEVPLSQRKFVLKEVLHRARAFAAPSEEQAREDFKARKQYRIDKLQSAINNCERDIKMLDSHPHRIRTNG